MRTEVVSKVERLLHRTRHWMVKQQSTLSLSLLGKNVMLFGQMKTSVDPLLPLPAKVDGLLTLKPTVERLEAHMQEMETKVDGLATKYDSVLEGGTKNENNLSNLEDEHDELREAVNRQAETIQFMRDEINNGEQYSRLLNLEIHGLPILPDENLRQRISDLDIHRSCQTLMLKTFLW